MDLKLCPFCSEEVRAEAIKCKHCGSSIGQVMSASLANSVPSQGTLWIPVPSLVLGIISVLALFDDSDWDYETIIGLLVFSLTSLTLGIIGVTIQQKGKGMSIAGIVLGAIAALVGLGLLSDY